MTQIATRARDFASALQCFSDLGPPSEIRSKCPTVIAETLGLHRVLLTRLREGQLVAEALHGESELTLELLRDRPVALEYPLIEGEILRRRRGQVVRAGAGAPDRRAFASVLQWTDYVAAPLLLDGRAFGFLHADSTSHLTDADAADLSTVASCLALVYERAVLRQRLREQRQEMRQIASWAEARTSDLGDRSVTLGDDDAPKEQIGEGRASGEGALRDLLTRREIEVLRLMVRGETNAGIARDLVVAEGTVKFHVKNILRKLHASNRAEATSRYMRITLNRG